jgi:hypothetical protein
MEAMRRGLLLLTSLALLSVVLGCKSPEVDPATHIANHPGNPMPPPGLPAPTRPAY